MPSLSKNSSIEDYQRFVKDVYGLPNDRHFGMWDMMSNVERFTMRALKGIRKQDNEKTKTNLLIATSWFMSTMNRLHINVEDAVWRHFPLVCSYCESSPCKCASQKDVPRRLLESRPTAKPSSINEFQKMFDQIYPHGSRTIEHAGVHLAEELGELSEALLAYEGRHDDNDFHAIELEAADFFSCIAGVFNSLEISMSAELARRFENNCHVCRHAPCTCSFSSIVEFKS